MIETTEAAYSTQTRAALRYIPKSFQPGPDAGPQTVAEELADRIEVLQYVEGLIRLPGQEEWISHAWCKTPDDTIVDPYCLNKYPDSWREIEYCE